jgi:hypothetical protein
METLWIFYENNIFRILKIKQVLEIINELLFSKIVVN